LPTPAFITFDAGNCTAGHYKPAFKRSHVQLILTVQGVFIIPFLEPSFAEAPSLDRILVNPELACSFADANGKRDDPDSNMIGLQGLGHNKLRYIRADALSRGKPS